MTFSPKHPCKVSGCSALLAAGQGSYCDSHKRIGLSASKAFDRFRGSAASRGYDSRWQEARLNFLLRFPVCIGVLMPTDFWSVELAKQFHALRVAERARGKIYLYSTPLASERKPGTVYYCDEFLAQNPIYHIEGTDLHRPAGVVDHIVPHKGDQELFWGEWNWQPLTKRAHDIKTGREERK